MKNKLIIFFLIISGLIASFNFVLACDCVSSAGVCAGSGGSVNPNPGIENTCAVDMVCCDYGGGNTATNTEAISNNEASPTSYYNYSNYSSNNSHISSNSGWSLSSISGFGLPSGSVFGIVANLLMWLLGIFGFIGVIGFVISGIFYLISAGDDDMVEKAKNGMKWSLIGVIVGLSGLVIIRAVDYALNAYWYF